MLARVEIKEIIVYFMYMEYLFGSIKMKRNKICMFSKITPGEPESPLERL